VPFLFIGIPLAAVVILNALNWNSRLSALWVAMSVALVQVALGAWDLWQTIQTNTPVVSTFFGTFSVDSFAAIVLTIIGFIVFITALVATSTIHASRFSFGSALLLLLMGMNGVVMVTDIFSLYVFIEVTGAASFLLIAIDKKRDEIEGAFKYYLMSALATTMLLLSIAFLFTLSGETSYQGIAAYVTSLNGTHPMMLNAAILLFVIALSIKSGVVPFHTWVPDAHSSAPSPVSVVLAGVVIKVSGVYALMRVYRDVFLNDPKVGTALMILAIVSILVGALGAIGQTDIKRMLAFSSVSQIGYIILGVSTGSALGFVGALMHFFNHATFKSLLFVDSAAIVHQTGTRDMDQMGGLGKKMPYTSISSIVGLLSMAGIPPLSGFWSKLIIVMAVWQKSPGVAIAALCLSVLTLGYFLILQKKVFFGKTSPEMEAVTECGGSMKFVEVLLSAVNVIAGLLFPVLLVYLHSRGII
jgi:proton-translocating NADH-quinone oxidoreductase chain N